MNRGGAFPRRRWQKRTETRRSEKRSVMMKRTREELRGKKVNSAECGETTLPFPSPSPRYSPDLERTRGLGGRWWWGQQYIFRACHNPLYTHTHTHTKIFYCRETNNDMKGIKSCSIRHIYTKVLVALCVCAWWWSDFELNQGHRFGFSSSLVFLIEAEATEHNTDYQFIQYTSMSHQ